MSMESKKEYLTNLIILNIHNTVQGSRNGQNSKNAYEARKSLKYCTPILRMVCQHGQGSLTYNQRNLLAKFIIQPGEENG